MTHATADLHVHTACSDGRPSPELLAERLVRSLLTVVAVTDHDRIEGALRTRAALAGRGPEIVVGTEVSTADGHVLGLFLHRDIPAGRSAAWTVDAIHEQDGIAIAAHPFSLAQGVGDLAAALPFDAIEVINGSPLMELANARAVRRFAGAAAALVGASDAHVAGAVGGVRTVFAGSTAEDLRAAILARRTRPAVHLPGRLAALPAHTGWLARIAVGRRQRSGPVGTPT